MPNSARISVEVRKVSQSLLDPISHTHENRGAAHSETLQVLDEP
jgi:hypothetical protein